MLTGSKIRECVTETKDIIIEPFVEKQLNPNSYNVKLHNELIVYDRPLVIEEGKSSGLSQYKFAPLDMRKDTPTKKIIIPEEGLLLTPGKLYLGRTLEVVGSNTYIPCIDGRSSVGRLGITVHVCAGFCDIGFKGTITLEISCVEPVIIYPWVEIGQVYFYAPDGDTSIQYNGRYQGQIDATASRLYQG